MVTVAELSTKEQPTWCPGCGDFTILSTLKNALSELQINTDNTVIVSGIGCGSKTPHFVNTYGFEGLHGRLLPVATGVKLANHKLTVIGIGGDGDGYGIGGNHFIRTMRRNLDMTYIIQNNAVYGLTKGQYSPTSEKGFKTPSSPHGALEDPLNPVALALTAGATFIARGNAMDIMHLKQLFKEAIRHRGFSLVDVFQPCTTYNKIQSAVWYKQNTYKVEEDKSYNPEDKAAAFAKAYEWSPKIPLGVLYKVDYPCYEDGLPQIKDTPLVHQPIGNIDIAPLMEKYK